MSKGAKVNINIGGGSLLICLILLKAFNVINWSWWWVFFPLWLPIIFLIIVGLLVLIGATLVYILE